MPVVKNLAFIAERVEIQLLARRWPERHAMRRVFNMNGRRRGRKHRRSGNGKRESASEQVRQAISDACHVDITLSQNRNPLHTQAAGETENYRENPPRWRLSQMAYATSFASLAPYNLIPAGSAVRYPTVAPKRSL